MDYLPIFVDLRSRDCVVVGGGEVAARKVAILQAAGARVSVIAPTLGDTLAEAVAARQVEHIDKYFDEALIETAPALIVAATNVPEVNEAVAKAAHERNVPVNVVDTPDLCTFVMPSIIDRSPVIIAISTSGTSPVLGRLLRQKLETVIPTYYGHLARLAAAYRDKVKSRFRASDRRAFWEKVLTGPIAEMVFAGKDSEANAALAEAIESSGGVMPNEGEVYLVGGGPGDPDLLTFKALRLMQQADVIVYDRLISPEVLELSRRDAQRIYVGKARGNHTLPQENINQLLVRLAKEGKRVCRLKGGDPFIFGRGGEEIETLMEEGVSFQIVPGITAAAGCASYSGFPLTHRDHAQSVIFVTGHLRDGTIDLNWPALAQPNQTIVFYMGLHGVSTICSELISHGLSSDTPAALVEQGTTRRHRTHIGTLDNLPDIVKSDSVKPPTLIIVGHVVKLHDKLAWFNPEETKDS